MGLSKIPKGFIFKAIWQKIIKKENKNCSLCTASENKFIIILFFQDKKVYLPCC